MRFAAVVLSLVAVIGAAVFSLSGNSEAGQPTQPNQPTHRGNCDVGVGQNPEDHPVTYPNNSAAWVILAMDQQGAFAVDFLDLNMLDVQQGERAGPEVFGFGTGMYNNQQAQAQFQGMLQMSGNTVTGFSGQQAVFIQGHSAPIVYEIDCPLVPVIFSVVVLKLNAATNEPMAGVPLALHQGFGCQGNPMQEGVTDDKGIADFLVAGPGNFSVMEQVPPGFLADEDGACKDTTVTALGQFATSGDDDLPECPIPNNEFPATGCDDFSSGAQVNVQMADNSEPFTVTLHGPVLIERKNAPMDTGGDGLDDVQTEIIGMKLEGPSQFGPLTVRQSPTMQSLGAFAEKENTNPGEMDFPADSFFDVFFEIQTDVGPLHNTEPVHMECEIVEIPPLFCLYQPPLGDPLPLFTEQGQLFAHLIHAAHIPLPWGQVLVVFNNEPEVFSIIVLALDSETGEPIPGTEVALHEGASCAGQPLAMGTTGSNGLFDFLDLQPGTYSVMQDTPAGHSADPDGPCKPASVGQLATTLAATFPPCPITDGDHPNPGCDEFDSGAQVTMELADGSQRDSVTLNGPTLIERKNAPHDNGNGMDVIDTEIVSLELTGSSLFGPVMVRQSMTDPSLGMITENQNEMPGVLEFPATSFFDVFVEIQTDIGLLHNQDPIRMQCVINAIPPILCFYEPPVDDPIELFTAQDQLLAYIIHSIHIPLPFNEILVIFNNAPGGIIFGDVLCSGALDSLDALAILLFVSRLPLLAHQPPCVDVGLTLAARLFGDVDCNGVIDAIDGLIILKIVAGLPVPPPPIEPGCPTLGQPT